MNSIVLGFITLDKCDTANDGGENPAEWGIQHKISLLSYDDP